MSSVKEKETGGSRRRCRKSSTDGIKSSRRRSSSRGSKSRRLSKRSGSSRRPHSSRNSNGAKRRRRAPVKNRTEENKHVMQVVKERAKRRQGTLECLQIMNLVLLLCLSISIFAVVVCLYVLEDQHNHWFYYLLQSVIEVVLTIVVSIIVCNPNTCFRILLISGHISTVIYSVFIILEQVRRQSFKFDCWNEEDTCFWQWPLKSDFEIGYLGLASILLHGLMFILSIMMVFYYEGSIDELKLTDKAHAILESQMTTNGPSRKKKERRKKEQFVVLEDGSSLRGKLTERTTNAVFVDEAGEPVVYGQTVTTSQSIVFDTPKAVEEKGRRQSILFEANGQCKKIVEIPALESPIAYLTRKQKEANEMKKSSYAF